MAISSSISITGSLTGLTEGSNSISFTYTNATAPGLRTMIRAAVTAVGIKASLPGAAWPSGSLFVLVVPGTQASSPTKLYLSASTTGSNGATVSTTQPIIIPLIASFSGDIFLGTDAGTIDCEVYVL